MVLTKRFDNKFKYLTSQHCLTGCSGDRKAADCDQEKDGLAKRGKKKSSVFRSCISYVMIQKVIEQLADLELLSDTSVSPI